MRRAITNPLLAGLLALAVAPVGAQAPERQPDSIPSELAVALVSSDWDPFGGGVPLFVVGRAPARFPAALVPPPPARVVGGMWTGASGSIVVAYPERDSAIARARQALLAAGWSPPAPMERSGFVSTVTYGDDRALCRPGEAAMLRPARVADGAGVRITWIGDDERTMCSRRHREPPEPFRRALELPLLVPPPGADVRGSGTGGGTNGFDAHATLEGTLATADLVAHYGRQLEAAGWKGQSLAASPSAAVQAFAAMDSKGKEWRGALTAIEIGPARRLVTVRMSQVDAR